MSYIHKEANLVYLAHPATASTATKNVLLTLGFERYGNHHSAEMISNHTIFTTVRNHFDAIASWAYKVAPKGLGAHIDTDWLTWLFYSHPAWFHKSGLWFHYQRFREHFPVYVLRFETLQEDLTEFLAEYKIDCPILPVENASKHRPKEYHDLFNDNAVKLIEWLWQAELHTFDYEF